MSIILSKLPVYPKKKEEKKMGNSGKPTKKRFT